MAVNTSEQIVREAADIEAYKIGLLQSAKALADQGIQLPPQMVAEMSQLQLKAGKLAQLFTALDKGIKQHCEKYAVQDVVCECNSAQRVEGTYS